MLHLLLFQLRTPTNLIGMRNFRRISLNKQYKAVAFRGNVIELLQTIVNYLELWRPCRKQMSISNKTTRQITRRSNLEPGHYSVKYSHNYVPQRKHLEETRTSSIESKIK